MAQKGKTMYKHFVLLVFLLISSNNIFGFGPKYRDEFYFVNMTKNTIVIILPTVRDPSDSVFTNKSIGAIFEDEEIWFTFDSSINDPAIEFRTLLPGEELPLGHIVYDSDGFNNLDPSMKLSQYFEWILLFDLNGNLLQKIVDVKGLNYIVEGEENNWVYIQLNSSE